MLNSVSAPTGPTKDCSWSIAMFGGPQLQSLEPQEDDTVILEKVNDGFQSAALGGRTCGKSQLKPGCDSTNKNQSSIGCQR